MFAFVSNIVLTVIVVYSLFKVYTELKNRPDVIEAEDAERNFRVILGTLLNSANDITAKSLERIQELVSNEEAVNLLRKELNNLKIDKSSIEENFARKEREIEHKLGLERMRQQQELELATREATLKAKEDNLGKERELFKKEMDFRQDRFEGEVRYQRELSERLLAALPNMTIVKTEHTENGNNTNK